MVSDFPNYAGFSGTCFLGAGGIWLPGISNVNYVAWQLEFPSDVRDALIKVDNPTGIIT